MNYRHSHTRTIDGSPAMLVLDHGDRITLVNEDGFVWTDWCSRWTPIPAEDDHDDSGDE